MKRKKRPPPSPCLLRYYLHSAILMVTDVMSCVPIKRAHSLVLPTIKFSCHRTLALFARSNMSSFPKLRSASSLLRQYFLPRITPRLARRTSCPPMEKSSSLSLPAKFIFGVALQLRFRHCFDLVYAILSSAGFLE